MKLVIRIALSIFFIGSLAINAVFFAGDILFDWNIRQLNLSNWAEAPLQPNIITFESVLYDGCIRNLQTKEYDVPRAKLDIRSIIKSNFEGYGDNHSFNYYGNGYLLWACTEYVIQHRDQNKIKEVAAIWKKKVSESNAFTVDQSLYGITACLLYKETKQSFYMNYADSLYNWLRIEDTDYGIPYVKADFRLVDGLGMFNPFLIEYARITNNIEAQQLAIKQIKTFAKYGIDNITGIPAHGFRTNSPRIKLGSANWGRGASWLAIGLLDISKKELDSDTQEKISAFETTMLKFYEESPEYSQFVGQAETDLSATIPVLYYLHKKKLISLSQQDVLHFSKYCHDGLMYNSSGDTEGLNVYNRYFGPYPLTQAMMMLLCLELEK